VESALREADLVLIPGFPLSHPDHRDVAEAIVTRLGERAVGLYVEQPYALAGGRPKVPPFLPSQPAMKMGWTRSRIPRALREVKWRSCQAYASQLPLLQSEWPLMRMRMELYELRHGEPVAWLP
jgi:LmbE family N-acetylglucosaminyl deacetylase